MAVKQDSMRFGMRQTLCERGGENEIPDGKERKKKRE
jgi:hypothetical protein